MFFLTAVAKKEPKKGDVHWMNSYTIGVDFGGGAAKATLLREDGTVVTTSQREYPTYYPENGWAEHDPDGHYDALCYGLTITMAQRRQKPLERSQRVTSRCS